MGKIKIIEHGGMAHELDLVAGLSLMQLAKQKNVPGIDGDCGGSCACGTCHVIVDRAWIKMTGEMTGEEQQMLSMSPERQDGSRLACQIILGEQMDGLSVRLPEFQM